MKKVDMIKTASLKKILHHESTIPLLLIMIIVFVLILDKNKKIDELFENGRYTTGFLTKINPMKGGYVYYYDFEVGGVFYEGNRKSGKLKKVGDHFYVIFNPDNYDDNIMLVKLPIVSDSIKNIPSNGWKELPIEVSEKQIKDAMK